MFYTMLKTAWQNLRRHTSYVVVNAIGLSVGIAASLLVYLLIGFETSFDDFHQKRDHVFRVVGTDKTAEGIRYSQASAYPIAEVLRKDYPQVTRSARIYSRRNQLITVGNTAGSAVDKKFKENVFYAENQFFSIFDFPLLSGDPNTVLKNKNTALLTQTVATRYFGDAAHAVGQWIRYGNDQLYQVTGILADPPLNTDFPLAVVLSFDNMKDQDLAQDWTGIDGSLNTFVELPSSVSEKQLNTYLAAMVQQYSPASHIHQGYIAQPLNEVHSDRRFGNFSGKVFSREMIAALAMVGIFLLVIACINFINLATAQAGRRAKEVGVRKVLGGSRLQLMVQFLCETFLITALAVAVALLLTWLVLPVFSQWLQTPLHLLVDPALLAYLIVITASVTLLSGFYPALILSGYQPAKVMKKAYADTSTGSFPLRKVLVVSQFTVAQALIIGTLVMVSQMRFFREAAVGFDKEAVLLVPLGRDTSRENTADQLKMQLRQLPGVRSVSLSTFSPMDKASWDGDIHFNHSPDKLSFQPDLKWADADFFTTYSIPFVAGEPYHLSDTVNGFVINELMMKKLGFSDARNIIGKDLSFDNGNMQAPITGVVKDFNGSSFEEARKPTVLASWKMVFHIINIKLEPQRVQQTLSAIETLWSAAFPGSLYEYQFLDEKMDGFYKQEKQLSQLFMAFAGMAIFISCLGLYGFVSFMTVQRNKEVGIRKVLGASKAQIVWLFSREFTLLVLLAFFIAAPIAYFVMHKWLQQYAYRIELSAGLFLLAVLVSAGIAWLTVGYQAMHAAMANPVKNLRTD